MDKISVNFNGYSGLIFLEGEQVSANNIQLSSSENLIVGDGAFGGSMNYGFDNYFRLNPPSFYELPDVSANLSIEPLSRQIDTLFFNFIEDRGLGRDLSINIGKNNHFNSVQLPENCSFFFNNCFFRSMSIQASMGSLLTINYDFTIITRRLLSNSINSDVEKQQGKPIFDMFGEENEINENKPIGFWETKISGFGNNKDVLSWNLTFTQDVIPKYYCDRSDDISGDIEVPLPKDVFIGAPRMNLSVEFIMDKNDFNKEIFKGLKEAEKTIYPAGEENKSEEEGMLSLYIRDKEVCRFIHGKCISDNPTIQSNGAIVYSANYLIHQIVIL